MLPLSLRQLQVFESVARHLSHSRAAAELYLSQPAISMQIKQVEQISGLAMFEQVGKKLFLTEAGRELLHYSRAIMQQMQELESVLGEMRGLERGHLNIAVVSTANYFMPQLLAKFIQTHANIQVSLHVANRDAVLRELTDNLADFAIMGLPAEDGEMDAHPFMENPLVIIAAPNHTLAGRSQITPGELVGETFLLREQGSGTRRVIERYFAKHRLPLPRSMEMDTNEAIKQSVQAGIGLGIISLHAIELELETARLRVLDVQGFPILRNWHIVHRKNKRLSLAAQAFVQFLLTEATSLTPLATLA
ncbi:LysR substrate-binding domain-containing protein [Ferriphaselus sp. R-1]|uniref:LysR substrate-binding domain-containing protein n=1 Tax=Ferriphaselus sp. R-1 TaxID=1485544 RepID=UPI0005582B18|nr:LysR substrate-binding domain-containing protein [Ferriphaselus sp. R-1]